MKKIKSLAQKQNNGTFSPPYPIGADSKNVDLKNGLNLEEYLDDLQQQISNSVKVEAGDEGKFVLKINTIKFK